MSFVDKLIDSLSNDSLNKSVKSIDNADDITTILGINPENYGKDNIKRIGYLDNYTETLATRTSSKRFPESNTSTQPVLNSTSIVKSYNNTQKDAIKLAASFLGRENAFQACFAAPFSYLEAVDPYGRVYKDTFGFRREETWLSDTPRLKSSNTDSKVFVAYIKVGMVAITAGNGLADYIKSATNGAVKTYNKAENEVSNFLFDKKNEASTQKKITTNDRPSTFTSYTLSYFVNERVLYADNNNKNRWQQGKVVPFNKFMKSALLRMIDTHTSPAVSSIEFANLQNNNRPNSINAKLREQIKKRINSVFGDNTYPFFKFIVSEETIVNETIMNQIGEGFLKEKLDKSSLMDSAKEINFITGGGDAIAGFAYLSEYLSKAIGEMGIGGSDMISGFISNIGNGLKQASYDLFGKNITDNILKGNSLIYPRVWKDSYIEKMLSLQVRLYSPYGDFFSIFNHILMPLTTLMGMALPRQVTPSFVSFPFTFSIEVPGLFASEFAMITNITLTRGGRYDAWSEASIMRGIDITCDITALKPMYGFPEEEVTMIPDKGKYGFSNDIYGEYESNSEGSRHSGDMTFANTLLNLSGSFIMTDQFLTKDHFNTINEAFLNNPNEVNKNFNQNSINASNVKNAVKSLNDNLLKKYNKHR